MVTVNTGVGDVVTGRDQLRLHGVQSGETDIEQACHDVSPDLLRSELYQQDACQLRSGKFGRSGTQPDKAVRRVLPAMIRVSLSAYIGSVA